MYYATSDLHGYPLSDFKRLLDSVGFGDDDTLYVLGDVIDGGDGGVGLLRWMMDQPNVELILGNHEAMLLSCDFIFDEITDAAIDALDESRIGALSDWMANGAEPTLRALRRLGQENPEALADLLDYLRDAPLYAIVETEANGFVLVHAGLSGFQPGKRLRAYGADDLLWRGPEADERYFDDAITVVGHVPTDKFGCPGRMFRTPTWIDIDTGAGLGRAPMLLCLDTLTPHYMPELRE